MAPRRVRRLAIVLASSASLVVQTFAPVMSRIPLAQRPRDLAYFLFFLVRTLSPPPRPQPTNCQLNVNPGASRYLQIHIPATVLLDCQALYPKGWVPAPLAALPKFYVDMSADPLIGGAMGLFGPAAYQASAWFRSFLMVEACVLPLVLPLSLFLSFQGRWGREVREC